MQGDFMPLWLKMNQNISLFYENTTQDVFAVEGEIVKLCSATLWQYTK